MAAQLVGRRRWQKPIAGRFLPAAGVILLLRLASLPSAALAEPAAASSTVTEEEVIARIVVEPAIDAVARGEAALVRAAALEAAALSNLELGYSREQVFDDQDASEDYLTISQTLPLSGARGLRLRAGEERARAAELSGRLERARLLGRARHLFYEALLARRRAEASERWIGRLTSALSIVAARQRSGDAAAYEHDRLERELSLARSRLARERASGRRLRGALAGVLRLSDRGFVSSGRVEGALLPRAALPSVDDLMAHLERRPDLLAFDEQIDAARLEERAARRGWVPALTVEGGWRSAVQGEQRAHGYVVSVGLELPLFDYDQGARRRASAEQRIAEGQRDLALEHARGVVVGLHAEVGALAEAASRFRQESEAARRDLVRAVEAAYRGDEASLLELLDVHRGILDDELHLLELEMSARRARIELDLALGRIQP